MLWPREAGKFIASKSKDVKIKQEGIKKVAEVIVDAVQAGKISMKEFKQNEVLPLNKGLTTAQLADWVFLIDTLNFNFWTPDGVPKFSIKYERKKRIGYLAMVACVNRAIDEGKKMYDPQYYSNLTMDDLKYIFRSDTSSTLPLFDERIRVIKEVGTKLIDKFNGSFINVLKQANGSAMKLVELVINNFPCFYDVAEYEGQKVAILKRVQILAADVWMLYCGEGLGNFSDIDQLTMFADYRVPQAMAHFGALEYSDSLHQRMMKEELFQSGDREEVEIRGCSIHATELIVEEAKRLMAERGMDAIELNSIKVDFFLWDYRINNAKKLMTIPYHRVRCIFY